MSRALLLLPMAAIVSGCYVAPPCDPVANVYWTFTVPGQGVLESCSQAGVDTVRISVDGSVVEDVACTTQGVDGIQLAGFGHGTHLLQLDVYSGGVSGTRRYQFVGDISFNGCTASYDVVATGVAGDLDLAYLFNPPTSCLANSYVWYQLRDAANNSYDVAPVSTANVCGHQPIGPLNLPAGVYTLSRFEVGQLVTGGWTPDYSFCAPRTFVHAGFGSLSTTLVPATASCWP